MCSVCLHGQIYTLNLIRSAVAAAKHGDGTAVL